MVAFVEILFRGSFSTLLAVRHLRHSVSEFLEERPGVALLDALSAFVDEFSTFWAAGSQCL